MGLALGLHLLTLVLATTLPHLLHHRPLLDQVVTVNLVSLPDVGADAQQPAAPPAAEKQAPPEPQPEPQPEPEPVPKLEPVKPKVQVAEPPPVVQEQAPAVKPVSLKPAKTKKKLADPEKIIKEQAEQQRQKDIAKAKLEEQNAQREAERARAALAEMIRARGVQQKPAPSGGSGRAAARQGVGSIVSQQYLMAVGAHMQQYWILPEMRQWDPRLETVVVLTIRRDGTVVRVEVEQESADPFFDRFVMKTIETASPMPQFPKLMTEDAIEVGFRFRPGEMVNMQ